MALSKLGIIGAGSVGSAVAFAAATTGVAQRITLQDINGARAEAEALDLRHGTPFLSTADIVGGDDQTLLADCDVVVLTAGAKQNPGQSRLDLAGANADLCRRTMETIANVAPDAVVVVVTNPLDVMTHVAQMAHPAGPGQVFGSGTVLDTARLRVLLADHLDVAPSVVHVSVIGEHGDSEFALWSSATVGGAPLLSWLEERDESPEVLDRILGEVRGAAQRVIAGKGATSTAIGLSTGRILRAIADDERSALPISTRHEIDGVGTVCLSLPTIVGRRGAVATVPVRLDLAEKAALSASAAAIRTVIDQVS